MFSYTAAGSFGFTRGTWDVFSSVGDVDVVLSRGEGGVLHAAAAVLVVLAGHLGLRGPLHGEAQAASTGTPARESNPPQRQRKEIIQRHGDNCVHTEPG